MSRVQKPLTLNSVADKDILEHLDTLDISYAKYIRQLIRDDMNNKKETTELGEVVYLLKELIKQQQQQAQMPNMTNMMQMMMQMMMQNNQGNAESSITQIGKESEEKLQSNKPTDAQAKGIQALMNLKGKNK